MYLTDFLSVYSFQICVFQWAQQFDFDCLNLEIKSKLFEALKIYLSIPPTTNLSIPALEFAKILSRDKKFPATNNETPIPDQAFVNLLIDNVFFQSSFATDNSVDFVKLVNNGAQKCLCNFIFQNASVRLFCQ